MKTILFLSLMIFVNTTMAATLPPHGMTCASALGNLDLYPSQDGQWVEVLLTRSNGTLVDDNNYSLLTTGKVLVYGDQMHNIRIKITGLEDENLTNTRISYTNELTEEQYSFSECDVH